VDEAVEVVAGEAAGVEADEVDGVASTGLTTGLNTCCLPPRPVVDAAVDVAAVPPLPPRAETAPPRPPRVLVLLLSVAAADDEDGVEVEYAAVVASAALIPLACVGAVVC